MPGPTFQPDAPRSNGGQRQEDRSTQDYIQKQAQEVRERAEDANRRLNELDAEKRLREALDQYAQTRLSALNSLNATLETIAKALHERDKLQAQRTWADADSLRQRQTLAEQQDAWKKFGTDPNALGKQTQKVLDSELEPTRKNRSIPTERFGASLQSRVFDASSHIDEVLRNIDYVLEQINGDSFALAPTRDALLLTKFKLAGTKSKINGMAEKDAEANLAMQNLQQKVA